MDLSYCVVNTNSREYLLACLEAIERTRPEGVEHELLVLDNASGDGSAEAVRERFPQARLFALERRTGKAENDSTLLREARGRYCLLLNEDSELQPGAARALVDALEAEPRAAAAGAQLLTSEGEPVPCAWRLPDATWALAAALFVQDRYAVQSRGDRVREVGWVQSSAMLVRRSAAERVGYLAEHEPPDRGVPPKPRPLLPKARTERHAHPLARLLDLGLPGSRRRRAGAAGA